MCRVERPLTYERAKLAAKKIDLPRNFVHNQSCKTAWDQLFYALDNVFYSGKNLDLSRNFDPDCSPDIPASLIDIYNM